MKTEQVKKIISLLESVYIDARPMLDFTSPYELLVAVTLSAQCTDQRVNKVTENLFKVANTPKLMSELSEEQIYEYIKTCGLGKTKSIALKSASIDILEKFDGQVPKDKKQLQTLRGVGVKTANVVASVAFGIPAIAVDTHVFRVSAKIGLASGESLAKTQKELEKNIDEDIWIKAHHLLIFHGRNLCKAQNPKCDVCFLAEECKYGKKFQRKS